eukprot:IDg173t1
MGWPSCACEWTENGTSECPRSYNGRGGAECNSVGISVMVAVPATRARDAAFANEQCTGNRSGNKDVGPRADVLRPLVLYIGLHGTMVHIGLRNERVRTTVPRLHHCSMCTHPHASARIRPAMQRAHGSSIIAYRAASTPSSFYALPMYACTHSVHLSTRPWLTRTSPSQPSHPLHPLQRRTVIFAAALHRSILESAPFEQITSTSFDFPHP